ncbi:hypothetical protein [Streptomyces sp. YGL11-2]|uniref:hypothetical protein n=1 Tax=Streptomyces sp. YGL11-2 TaxID=3414028 RepID=UPI003CEDEF94
MTQTQQQAQHVAPGFEAVAQAVAATLENLPAADSAAEDQQDAGLGSRSFFS